MASFRHPKQRNIGMIKAGKKSTTVKGSVEPKRNKEKQPKPKSEGTAEA